MRSYGNAQTTVAQLSILEGARPGSRAAVRSRARDAAGLSRSVGGI